MRKTTKTPKKKVERLPVDADALRIDADDDVLGTPNPSDATPGHSLEGSQESARRPVKDKKFPVLCYANEETRWVGAYGRMFIRAMKDRIAFGERWASILEKPEAVTTQSNSYWVRLLYQQLGDAERIAQSGLVKLLRRHQMYDWLSGHRIAGARMAVVLGVIKDPRRFAGPRSLWSFAGLRPGVDGRLLHHVRGVQSQYNTHLRTQFLMPSGIADAVIRTGVANEKRGWEQTVYNHLYHTAKAERQRARGVCTWDEWKQKSPEEQAQGPQPLLKHHQVARIIVAKRILADVWRAWCLSLGGFNVDGTIEERRAAALTFRVEEREDQEPSSDEDAAKTVAA
jgi:hypothetical protein